MGRFGLSHVIIVKDIVKNQQKTTLCFRKTYRHTKTKKGDLRNHRRIIF